MPILDTIRAKSDDTGRFAIPWHMHIHDSLRDAGHYIANTKRNWSQDSSVTNAAQRSWDLGAGMAGALTLARDGWREGSSRLHQRLSAMPANDIAPKHVWRPDGGRVSVARAMGGNPNCYKRKSRIAGQQAAVSLVIGISANGGTNADNMARYGLAVAAYVEQLERANVPVEVTAVLSSSSHGDHAAITGWKVKAFNEPFNMADMAFSLGHTAAFRRLGFALHERSTCQEMWGYGAQTTPPDEILARIHPDAIYLGGMANADYHSTTDESAADHLSDEITIAMNRRDAIKARA